MYYVYILHSAILESYYVGEAQSLDKRIEQHNAGFYKNSYTSKTKNWKLFLSFECKDRIQARKIETHIKKMKSRKYIQDLLKYPDIIEELLEKY